MADMMLSNGRFYNKRDGSIIDGISDEFRIVLALASVETAGGVAALLNPFGVDVIIIETILDVTVAADAAATLDIGVAANGTTSNDSIIDGVDVNTAVGVFSNTIDGGTNGGYARLDDDEYITASKATGSVAGLEGMLYIRAMPVQS